jgi:hypothetical protein
MPTTIPNSTAKSSKRTLRTSWTRTHAAVRAARPRLLQAHAH